MQGIKRKVTYVFFYELISLLLISSILFLISGKGVAHSGMLGVMIVAVAVIWNVLYNTVFEYWESSQTVRGRSVSRRVVHTVGFELGLVVLTLPLFAWWLEITLLEAFVVDIGFTLFFLFFTFLYNLFFDRIFGLPLAAQ